VAQQHYREAADSMEAPPEVTRALKIAGKNGRLISIRLIGRINTGTSLQPLHIWRRSRIVDTCVLGDN
jgi:hypothetical protein